ncbi:MAG: DUF814 domain-containing protein [Candidatus Eisenbacteria bacterium]|nr:DUF814 domain-containing protein [Candidatus Eisenbacteria bacterium]
MNAPALYLLARALGGRLSGSAFRYALQADGIDGPAPVYLLRFELPAGTLALSLRPGAPAAALLAKGESPAGSRTPAANRLDDFFGGGRVVSVTTPGVDRSFTLECEDGKALRAELFGGRPRLTALDETGRALFTLPEGTRAGSAPGAAAPPLPGMDRPDPLTFDPESITAEDAAPDGIGAFLRRATRGMPQEWAEEVAAAIPAEGAPEERRRAAVEAWRDLADALRGGGSAGVFLYERKGRPLLSAVPLPRTGGEGRAFASIEEGAAALWRETEGASRGVEALGRVRAAVTAERKKLRRLLENLERELAVAERHPEARRRGEILSIHFQRLERGMDRVSLPDPYEGGEIEIDLDPKKGPRENIERWFRAARKGERATPILRRRVEDAKGKLAEAEALIAETEDAVDEADAERLLARARPLLGEERPEKAWEKRARRPKERKLPIRPREYALAGGYTALVGRDNKENDLLTMKFARPGDLFLHAGQSPGSHVILLRDDPKKPVPSETLLQAAALAAHYSRARHASKVPVIYTERRYVRKPKGAPPGRVSCEREKTLFVEPGLPAGDS